MTDVTTPTNGAEGTIGIEEPYTAETTIQGTADLLFHGWNVEAIEEKSKASKGSEAKKTDNIETYVLRDNDGFICLPSEYLRMSIVNAARRKQDPSSPRKSAYDPFKASVIALEPLVPTINAKGEKTKEWDFAHKCRVQVQRSGIARCRPAFHKGWRATVQLMVMTPEYISQDLLHDVAEKAGRLNGVGDYRPTHGRFRIVRWEIANA